MPWEQPRTQVQCLVVRHTSRAYEPLLNQQMGKCRYFVTYLTTSISPVKLSLTSRTKKSVLGPPIPVLTIEIGTPLYRPVIVVKPRSEVSLNGVGLASRCFAISSALEGEPTAICKGDFNKIVI